MHSCYAFSSVRDGPCDRRLRIQRYAGAWASWHNHSGPDYANQGRPADGEFGFSASLRPLEGTCKRLRKPFHRGYSQRLDSKDNKRTPCFDGHRLWISVPGASISAPLPVRRRKAPQATSKLFRPSRRHQPVFGHAAQNVVGASVDKHCGLGSGVHGGGAWVQVVDLPALEDSSGQSK